MQSYAELVRRQRIDEDGEKIPMADVLGREVVVAGFDMRPSNMHKPDYLCLKILLDGEKKVLFTDSIVLRRQCERFADDMPFTATITKRNQYFTFA
ncbi:MAG: hypothetical protein LUD50_02865 [Clostridia bacterium]|nr:hypothetical protein [Clostridia bacterium]